jgi:hypothetical protein
VDQHLEDFACPAAEYETSIMCAFITTAEGLIRSNFSTTKRNRQKGTEEGSCAIQVTTLPHCI